MVAAGLIPILRFGYFYYLGDGEGHIQSLVLGGMLFSMGFVTMLSGILADLINFNRKLMEKMLLRMERLEQTGEKSSDKLNTDPTERFSQDKLKKELDELTGFMREAG